MESASFRRVQDNICCAAGIVDLLSMARLSWAMVVLRDASMMKVRCPAGLTKMQTGAPRSRIVARMWPVWTVRAGVGAWAELSGRAVGCAVGAVRGDLVVGQDVGDPGGGADVAVWSLVACARGVWCSGPAR